MNGDGGRSVAKAIGIGVLVCGTLDILDAIVFYRVRSAVSPERVLQSVASGLLGRAAFTGGVGTAVVGLVVHFCVTTAWVALFVLVAQRVRWIFRQAVVAGALYGLVVYGVMNYVVLPLTRRPPSKAMTGVVLANAVAALVLFIGVAVGLVNRRFAP